jgi:hypothetical protein
MRSIGRDEGAAWSDLTSAGWSSMSTLVPPRSRPIDTRGSRHARSDRIHVANGSQAFDLAAASLTLARALWLAGENRLRARALVEQARDDCEREACSPEERAELEQWQLAHGE